MSPAPFFDAVLEGDTGVYLDLEVTPAAAQARFPDGYNPWRKRIGVRVTAAPQEGAANRAVLRAVAEFFGVAPTQVTLVAGATAREKRVHVTGLARAAALARLEAAS